MRRGKREANSQSTIAELTTKLVGSAKIQNCWSPLLLAAHDEIGSDAEAYQVQHQQDDQHRLNTYCRGKHKASIDH